MNVMDKSYVYIPKIKKHNNSCLRPCLKLWGFEGADWPQQKSHMSSCAQQIWLIIFLVMGLISP